MVLRIQTALLVVPVVLVLGACSGSGSKAVTFKTQPGFVPSAPTPTCLVHQDQMPSGAFMAGPEQNLGMELPFLAYYTAAGTMPFCDGKTANKDDVAWAKLYVVTTGANGKVTTILGGG